MGVFRCRLLTQVHGRQPWSDRWGDWQAIVTPGTSYWFRHNTLLTPLSHFTLMTDTNRVARTSTIVTLHLFTTDRGMGYSTDLRRCLMSDFQTLGRFTLI